MYLAYLRCIQTLCLMQGCELQEIFLKILPRKLVLWAELCTPQIVTMFGDRVFAEVIKLIWDHLIKSQSSLTHVLRRNQGTDIHSQCWSCLIICDPMDCSPPGSIEFSRQEYWSGLPFPSPADLPNPGIEPRSPELQADSLPAELPGKPWCLEEWCQIRSIVGVRVVGGGSIFLS